MKNKLLLLVAALLLTAASLHGQGTAFTYNGRLVDTISGSPLTGLFDMRFELYSVLAGSGAVGLPLTNAATPVTNGLFTVTLDFGPGIFTGAARWLQIGVTNYYAVPSDPWRFTTLVPRQALTPSPYAIYAAGAATASTVANGAVANAALAPNAINAGNIAPAQVVKSLNGLRDDVTLTAGANVTLTPVGNSVQISAGAGGSGWALTGNSALPGQFLGTANNQPLDLKVNGTRGLRLEPTTDGPNVVGGANVNLVAPGVQGATIGGGGSIIHYGAPYPNQVNAFHGTIGGGLGNTIQTGAYESTIAGGNQNVIIFDAFRSTIGGGFQNFVSTNCNTSTIAGGERNVASNNAIFVGGGTLNYASGSSSTIAGGYDNAAAGDASFIGGGARNRVPADYATVGGGDNNQASGGYASVGGGYANTSSGGSATVGGGYGNTSSGNAATVGGGEGNTVSDGQYATVGGGRQNGNSGNYGTVGGGYQNTNYGAYAVVGGGDNNFVSGDYATVSGGRNHYVSRNYATVGGGERNLAFSDYATVGGGTRNQAYNRGTVSGGEGNQSIGSCATVPGGSNNFAGGAFSFAAGQGAAASDRGSFVWADARSTDMFFSQYENQFRVRAFNGARFDDGTGLWVEMNRTGSRQIDTSTTAHLNLGGVWVNASDVALKENFKAVNPRRILELVAQLPISTWNYRKEGEAVSHLGPMAQDFHAAFHLGDSDKHIGTVDEGGVALAAIQGLHLMVKERDAGIQALEKRVAELETKNEQREARLTRLEKALESSSKAQTASLKTGGNQ